MGFVRSIGVSVVLAGAALPAPASEGGGGLGEQLIRPEWGTLIWTVITFVIMLFILKRFAWKPLLGALATREQTIQGGLEQARKEREEAQLLLEKHRALIVEARRERAGALAQGQRDAERVKAEILDEAKRQRDQMLEQMQVQMQASLRQVHNELRRSTADLAIEVAQKLLSRNLDDATHRRLVEEHLADLERSAGKFPSLPT